MKKIFLFLVMSISLACSTQERKVSVYDVVPFPNEVQEGEGVFNAQGAAVCCCGELDEASRNVVEAFAQKLSAISGVESACGVETACNTQTACGAESACNAGSTCGGKSVCCGEATCDAKTSCGAKGGFAFVYDETVANEAYTLDICPEGVTVKASGLRGFNYAIQTLKQLLCIMEHHAGGVHLEGGIGNNAGIMPALIRSIVHQEHVVGRNLTEAQLALIGRECLGGSCFDNLDIQHIKSLLLSKNGFILLKKRTFAQSHSVGGRKSHLRGVPRPLTGQFANLTYLYTLLKC